MPVKKPSSLTVRHSTKAEAEAKSAGESAMTPRTRLTAAPPVLLKGHKTAITHWKRLIGLYGEIEGQIVTAFDADLLAKYCLLEEECDWLAGIRKEIGRQYEIADKRLTKIRPKSKDLKDYYNALMAVNALLARLQGFDARLDGKRKLLHTLAQSLYLTPRARAGVPPPEKAVEEETDDMGKLLGE